MAFDPLQDLEALNALSDATRRRVYAYASTHDGPASRDDVAGALEIGRTLAAYHLDRLAAEGLLEVTYARVSGRSGRGAGRPAKLYTRSQRELAVSLPRRDYGLAATLLAQAAAADRHGDTRQALLSAARTVGCAAGAGTDDAEGLPALLRDRGYEPYRDGAALRMRNCPFREAARRHPEVICDMNLALVEGMVTGSGDAHVTAVLEPGAERCCVALKERN